jgi:transketolase
LQLGRLIVLYDDNSITIDGDTALSFTEDVLMRFKAYGWHTASVGDGDGDLDGLKKAIDAAKAVRDKPSIIKVKTTIGFGYYSSFNAVDPRTRARKRFTVRHLVPRISRM